MAREGEEASERVATLRAVAAQALLNLSTGIRVSHREAMSVSSSRSLSETVDEGERLLELHRGDRQLGGFHLRISSIERSRQTRLRASRSGRIWGVAAASSVGGWLRMRMAVRKVRRSKKRFRRRLKRLRLAETRRRSRVVESGDLHDRRVNAMIEVTGLCAELFREAEERLERKDLEEFTGWLVERQRAELQRCADLKDPP